MRSLEAVRTTTSALVRNISVRLSPTPRDSTATDGLRLTTASKQLFTLIASGLKELTLFSFTLNAALVDPFLHPTVFECDGEEDKVVGMTFSMEVSASLIDPLPESCTTLELNGAFCL
jgi:hypothetical protein